MIKALITIVIKLIEAKLEKVGIEQVILKNQNYITVKFYFKSNELNNSNRNKTYT